jgi:hypothetical protein
MSKLHSVEVFENGQWSHLPEKHHTAALALGVARKEARARQCKTRVEGIAIMRPWRRK